ncbi:uncharacterized protein LOC6726516 [Drosophila simulans]|uniref:GD15540 n=1 Tax=Drosophila simulans TaxID=7240 RepID=B4R2X8_DROSI|nr:uncharacterized protein LOC6726516 [Drosophila simulans]EDX18455.1 GD15540 [Drosophila simulans]KMZ10784.1 uncharacterized protein Dsimw501_GD15540 [Drosophila simulans]
MDVMGALVNLLLISACAYTMCSLTLAEHPYAYLAASFSLVHGLLGVVRSFAEEPDECGHTFDISASILEVIPLPLANIEFYLVSDQPGVALVHGMSLIPLFYDMIGKMSDEWDSSTDTLKDLALLGNIGSTLYLAIKDGNHLYFGVAANAFLARFGGAIVGNCNVVETLANTGILALMTYSLRANC